MREDCGAQFEFEVALVASSDNIASNCAVPHRYLDVGVLVRSTLSRRAHAGPVEAMPTASFSKCAPIELLVVAASPPLCYATTSKLEVVWSKSRHRCE